MGDVGGELAQHRPRALGSRHGAPQHEGESALEGGRSAPRQRGVDPGHAGLGLEPRGHDGGGLGVDAAHVDQELARSGPGGNAVGPKDDALDDLGGVEAGDHVVDLARECRRPMPAARAPLATSGASLAGSASRTVSSCPRSSSRVAIAVPMTPTPTNPILRLALLMMPSPSCVCARPAVAAGRRVLSICARST